MGQKPMLEEQSFLWVTDNTANTVRHSLCAKNEWARLSELQIPNPEHDVGICSPLAN
jgi:hypothetical protein